MKKKLEKCANFMNLEAMQQTVREYEERWGALDGSTNHVPTDCHNCVQCFYGDKATAMMLNAVGQVTQDILSMAEATAIRLTGEPFKRKCFKELKI